MKFALTTTRAAATAVVLGAALLAAPTAANADIDPVTNTIVIEAGGTGTEDKTVTVPELPAKADILIAIDTTGSMGGAIDQAKSEATALVNSIQADIPDANFAIVEFRDAGDTPEYAVRQANTDDAAAVQAAINTLSAGGGGDFPEAQNLVLSNAATDDPALWRADSRRFVVLITDAPPHGAATNGFPACGDTSADPNGLKTNEVVDALEAKQTTLFAVTANSFVDSCYAEIAATSFPGSVQASLGTDLSTQIKDLIIAASGTVSDVHLEVVLPNANASWISFDPTSAGPVTTPATLPFTVNIAVPDGTAPGDYVFDIVALADGGDIGHQALTITVPVLNEPPDCTGVTPDLTSLWPPNHTFRTVTLSGATDPDGDAVTINVTGVTQDEPLNGTGDGDTAPDAQASAPGSVDLRAERAGTGDGRVYRIAFTADDGNGGTCTGTTNVTVPKSQGRNGAAVGSALVVNSFGP